ncbi:MAG: esterase-like activity of phytase family protein [Rhizobiaceae bacterium]|nr:esterase-like activity of phytase family protein [Rhizobiaceae bacterium]
MINRPVIASLLLTLGLSTASFAEVTNAEINIRQISHFKVGSDETTFGSFKFLGGIEFESDNDLVGAISGFRFLDDRTTFLAVADTGYWFKGELERDTDGLLKGVSSFQIASILDQSGRPSREKWQFDAEGLAIKDGRAFVSFERNARIDGYPLDNVLSAPVDVNVPVQIPAYEFRRNGGLEALAVSPKDGPLEGSMVALAERSVDEKGNLFAAIVDGPKAGVFTVKRNPPFNITDADFLPNGDLLVLERRFNIASGVGMRIRRIAGADIKKGALVDGNVLLEAGSGYQIDNMEGMSITKDEKGHINVTLVSDDNHSFLQRNLLLEFRLIEN